MPGWDIVDDRIAGRIHVVPADDDRAHVHSAACWCKPRQDDEEPRLFLHAAADGREAYERGERKVH